MSYTHLSFIADELLQEQKADMDQFLSSISESQPDVTVSSEESVEVPMSEGKPYRPFQVTSLGSRLEPEGEQLQPQTQSQAASWMSHWLCGEQQAKHTFWRTLVTKHTRTVAQWGRIGLQCVLLYVDANVLWSHWYGLSASAQFPQAKPSTQHYWSSDKCTKPQALVLSWGQRLRKKRAVMSPFLVTYVPNKRLNPQGDKKVMDGTLPGRWKANYK